MEIPKGNMLFHQPRGILCRLQIHWCSRYFPRMDSPNSQKEPTVIQASSRIHEINECEQPEYLVSRIQFFPKGWIAPSNLMFKFDEICIYLHFLFMQRELIVSFFSLDHLQCYFPGLLSYIILFCLRERIRVIVLA